MRQLRSGLIIMVSCISGLHLALAISSYSASKFALEGWSESLRFELRHREVRSFLWNPSGPIYGPESRIGQRPSLIGCFRLIKRRSP